LFAVGCLVLRQASPLMRRAAAVAMMMSLRPLVIYRFSSRIL